VQEDGGRFFDLFGKYPLERLGDDSLPVPSRFVTFAAAYAEQICGDVESTGARLVVHDSFAVVGRLVARLLGIPRVNVCAGHNMLPERFLPLLRDDPRVRTSAQCLRAVQTLRESFGMDDASPFSYLSPPSKQLNICCEPPEFLTEAERQAWEPLAFFGSIRDIETGKRETGGNPAYFADSGDGVLKAYVAFGTVIWRYYADPALRALRALADAFADRDDVQAVISLGGAEPGRAARNSLSRRNVRVEHRVDQQAILGQVDFFVTHHGMNSTHESIVQEVPMMSYPFFWDQPELARKCQEFNLALPLAGTVRGGFTQQDVGRVLNLLGSRSALMKSALGQARAWEEAVIANRPAVIGRITQLIG
jgi:UDP:flavonoid glycosyltransferase YjiC (YdhE family)